VLTFPVVATQQSLPLQVLPQAFPQNTVAVAQPAGDLPYAAPGVPFPPPQVNNDQFPLEQPAELPIVAPLVPAPQSPANPADLPVAPVSLNPSIELPPFVPAPENQNGGLPTISPDTAVFPSFEPLPAASPFPTSIPSLPSNNMFVASETSAALPLPTGLSPGKTSLTQVFPAVVPLAQATITPQQCVCVPLGTCVSAFGAGGTVSVRIVTQVSSKITGVLPVF